MLAVVRLAWRFYNAPPPLPEFMERWEKITALTVHYLLYGLLLVMPITGWATTSAKGKPVVFLGIVQLPDFVAEDRAFGKQLEEIHGCLGYVLATLITLHVLAALYHHFIKRDSVLKRMWSVSSNKK
jgi:cytochrome b561